MINLLYQSLVDLLFPMYCESCSKIGKYLCDECRKNKFQYIVTHRCHVCKQLIPEKMVHDECRGNTNIDGIIVVSHYNKFIESYLADIKYNFYYAMLADIYEIMLDYLIHNPKYVEIIQTVEFFIGIPLYRERLNWRGFNQSELLAKNLAASFDKEFISPIMRVRNTNSQLGLDRKGRLLNLVGSMKMQNNSLNLKNKNIIIVDDVMTTGATMEECARVLKEAGAGHIYGIVFARG